MLSGQALLREAADFLADAEAAQDASQDLIAEARGLMHASPDPGMQRACCSLLNDLLAGFARLDQQKQGVADAAGWPRKEW